MKKNKPKTPNYLIDIINQYPNLSSGRKNYNDHEIRINNILELIKKFKQSLNKKK